MHRSVIERMSGYPQKLVDLKLLEEELHTVIDDENVLVWNQKRRCVEHRFNDEWEIEYQVLQHWADHVGADFEISEEAASDGYYHAFIYR